MSVDARLLIHPDWVLTIECDGPQCSPPDKPTGPPSPQILRTPQPASTSGFWEKAPPCPGSSTLDDVRPVVEGSGVAVSPGLADRLTPQSQTQSAPLTPAWPAPAEPLATRHNLSWIKYELLRPRIAVTLRAVPVFKTCSCIVGGVMGVAAIACRGTPW